MASSPATAPAAPPAAAAAPDARVAALRQALAQADGGKGVQAFIVPSEDPHMVGAAQLVVVQRRVAGHGRACAPHQLAPKGTATGQGRVIDLQQRVQDA